MASHISLKPEENWTRFRPCEAEDLAVIVAEAVLEEKFGSSIWFNRRWSGQIGCFALCGAGGRPLPGRAVLGGSFGGGRETGAAETQGGHVSHGGSTGNAAAYAEKGHPP